MKFLKITLLLSIICLSGKCQHKKQEKLIDFEEPAKLITNFDSLINENRHMLSLSEKCDKKGKSYISLVIEANGDIDSLKVMKGLAGCAIADSIAISLVKQLKFEPAKYKGKSIRSLRVVPIPFGTKN